MTDVINGGAGTDTLSLVLDTGGTALPAASISNVEILKVRDTVGATLDLDNIASATSVVLNGGSANTTLQNVDTRFTSIEMSSVKGDLIVDTGDITTLAVTLGTISGKTADDDVDLDITEGNTAITTLNLTTTGNAALEVLNSDEVETATVAATGGTLTVVDWAEAGALETLTVSGSSNVTFSDLTDAAALTTVTSTSTGTLDLDYGAALSTTVTAVTVTGAGAVKATSGAITTSITGGDGNDTIGIGAFVYSGSGKVAGGAGTDTLSISDDTTTMFTTAALANISGFETLDITGSTANTYDFSKLSGLTALTLGANTNITVSNLTSSVGVTITGKQSTDVELGVKDATDAGTSDTLSVTTDTTDGAFEIVKFGSDGLETLNLTANKDTSDDDLTISAFEAATDITKISITGAGDVIFTTTAAATVLDNISASGMTGDLTVTAVAATKNLSITSGSGTDDLNGSALLTAGDVLSAGAGDDRLTGNGGADKYTGGAGADTFQVDTVNGSNAATVNTITDFAKGTGGDQIELSTADIEALNAGTYDLVDGNTATIGTGSLTVKEISADTTVAAGDEIFVLTGATFATTSLLEDAIETGAFEITLASAPTALDAILLVYSDGTDSYLAVAGTSGTAADLGSGEMTVTNLVKLTGITSIAAGDFVTANFELLA